VIHVNHVVVIRDKVQSLERTCSAMNEGSSLNCGVHMLVNIDKLS